MTNIEAIVKVLKHYGSQRKLAQALCVTEGAVSQWVRAGSIPSRSALKIERAMRGRVRAAILSRD